MTTLLLIRHGESKANRKNIFAGQLDVELEENGVQQAIHTARYIAENYRIDKVYASDLKRAYRTGEIIAKKSGVKIIPDKRLREISAGEWDGRTYTELMEKYPDSFGIWKKDIGRAKCPGGETTEELSKRIINVLTEIAEENDSKTIVVATHATPVRTLECVAKFGNILRMNEIDWVSNASVSEFKYKDGIWTAIETSYDAHLEELKTALPDTV